MNSKYIVRFILMALFTVACSLELFGQACGLRYLNEVFSNINVNTVQFDVQVNYQQKAESLMADIYMPSNDTARSRAAIIYIHGGGFVGGSRDGGNIPLMCRKLAKRGYVVASIDYRLGVTNNSAEQKGKAQIRAIQDLKSFIRFTKQRLIALKIDSNRIFIAGSSAGGATSLATAYMSYEERPSYMDTTGVGSLDGRGNINGFNAKVKAVYSMWGAVGDTLWIQPGDIPVGCIQSKYDPCIPWTYSPSSCNVPGYPIYGSSSINQRALHVGIYSTLYGFNTDVHDYGLDDLGLDTTITQMSSFYYTIMCSITTRIEDDSIYRKVSISPNPFNKSINIGTEFNYKKYMLCDIHSRVIKQGDSISTIDTSEVPVGFYLLYLYNDRQTVVQKVIKLGD